MATAENAKLQYEAGQTFNAMQLLTANDDNKQFYGGDNLWSDRSGYAPDVRPNGLVTGCVITAAASGSDNVVDVSSGTAYIKGVITNVSAATDVTCSRGATTDVSRTNSITITNAGTIAAIAGAAHTSQSTTRAADGGPPLILPDSIEIGQVVFSSIADAPAASTEIFQVTGNHTERYDYPTYDIELAVVENQVIDYAGIEFDAANTEIHDDIGTFSGVVVSSGTDTWTNSGHGLEDGDTVLLAATTIAGGFNVYTKYHVVNETADTFELSLTAGGAAIASTSAGTAVTYAKLSGTAPRRVYASWYDPIFADISKCTDFVPAENTHSVSSTTIYGGTIGAKSSSLGQGSFTAFMSDGATDALVKLKDEKLWFKYFPDRDKSTPYIITNGYLGISRTFPAGDSISASCTISAESQSLEVAG